VYQNHRYELIRPLPPVLEDFTAGEGPVQAVKVAGEDRYAVQFHPEVGGGPAQGIISNFVVLCSRRR
jgi:GMP synthase-like glutamine amidotransferase